MLGTALECHTWSFGYFGMLRVVYCWAFRLGFIEGKVLDMIAMIMTTQEDGESNMLPQEISVPSLYSVMVFMQTALVSLDDVQPTPTRDQPFVLR